ncbi:NAD(P)H-binding protein [Bacillus sp. YH3-2-B2]
MSDKKALVVGATGLVGTKLIEILLKNESYSEIIVLARKPLEIEHEKLKVLKINFDHLEDEYPAEEVTDVFCCLGTTIKKAKSKDQMYKVDVEYPYQIATLAKKNGLSHFLLVSAMGANPKSNMFYTRIKGELEDKLLSLNLPKLSVFRPSLLIADREEFRLGELIAVKLVKYTSWAFPLSIQAKMGIKPSVVAHAMNQSALRDKEPLMIYESRDMIQIDNIISHKELIKYKHN